MSTDKPPVISDFYGVLSSTSRDLVDGWHRSRGVLLETLRLWVPLIADDKVQEMREQYPRLFPFIRMLYRKRDVTDAHVGTLLFYSGLCQREGYQGASHYLSPDAVFTWMLTGNTDLWIALNMVYQQRTSLFTRLFPPDEEEEEDHEEDWRVEEGDGISDF